MKKYYYKVKNINLSFGHWAYVSIILCVALLFANFFSYGLFNIPADTKTYWEDNCKTVSISTSTSCYYVATPNQLAYIFFELLPSQSSSDSINVKLVNDIDLSQHYWGETTLKCSLIFDGNYRFIRGLKNSCEEYGGLLSNSSSGNVTFKNTYIECNITINYTTNCLKSFGAFVGELTYGTLNLINCKSYGNINITTKQLSADIGGFVGKVAVFNAENCVNSISITGQSGRYAKNIGGFIGNVSNDCNFCLCANYGNISGDFKYVGGLAGYVSVLKLKNARSFNDATIKTTYSKTNAYTGKSELGTAGGLVGYCKSANDSTVSYVYNKGEVSSTGIAGGLIGDSMSGLYFSNVYNSANVTATQNITGGGGFWSPEEEEKGYDFYDYDDYEFADPIPNLFAGKYYFIQNKGDYAYYQIDLKCKSSWRDISLIGDDAKILSKSNVYAVKPDCIKLSLYVTDYQYGYEMNLYEENVYGGYNVKNYLWFETGYFQNLKNNPKFQFGYYGVSFTNNSKYCGTISSGSSNGETYYVDNFFDDEEQISVSNNTSYDWNGDLYDNVWHYLLLSNATYIYSILKPAEYSNNGLPKLNNGAINYSALQELVTGYFWNRTAPAVSLVGLRGIYFYRNNRCDLLIYPLMKLSFSDLGDYYLPLLYLAKGKSQNDYVIDSASSNGIPIYSITDPCPIVEVGQVVNRYSNYGMSSFSTESQIKSASFSGSYYVNTKDKKINDGFPVFKEMYWELCI